MTNDAVERTNRRRESSSLFGYPVT